MARLEPTKEIVRRLFALSGNQCAFPGCTHKLVDIKGRYIGNMCHIEAAEEGGERYNKNQSDEERRSFENLILLCPTHHTITNDEEDYTTDVLKEMKRNHEGKFQEATYIVSDKIIDDARNDLLQEIKAITTRTELDTKELIKKNEEIKGLIQSMGLINSKTDYLTREFENLKELKEGKNYSAILTLLSKYKTSDWSQLSNEQKYKIDLNLAFTYLDLVEEKKAAIYLIELPKYEVKLEDALSYAALGHLLIGNSIQADELIQKVLLLNSNNETAILSLIISKGSELTIEELENLIPEKLSNSPTIALNLALKALHKKMFDKALKWIDISILNSKEDSSFLNDAKAQKATMILQSKQDNFKDAYNQFSEEEIKEFEAAESLLQESWNYFKDTELRKSRGYYLSNLSAAKKFVGKMEEALTDAEDAVKLTHSPMSYFNFILLLIENKNFDKALQIVKEAFSIVDSKEDTGKLILFKASCYENKKMHDEAIAVLLNAISSNEVDNFSKEEILNKLVLNYLFIDNIREAIRYLEILKAEFPNNIATLYLQSRIDRKTENIDDFKKSLDAIYEKLLTTSVKSRKVYLHYLADDYAQIQDFKKAKECFIHIVDKKIFNDLTKSYLISLFNNGDYNEIIDIATPLKTKYPNENFICEILYQVYYNNTNYNAALSLCNEIIASNKNVDIFILKKCFLNIKLGNESEIEKDLQHIQSITSFSLLEVFNYAYLFAHIGNYIKALEIAYHARIDNYHNPEVHNKYFAFITQLKDLGTSFWIRETVDVNTTVFLESQHNKKIITYTIVDYNPKSPDEINAKSDFSIKLLNKKLGDVIEIDSNNTYLVVKIYSKYKYALEDTLEILDTKFSIESTVKTFHFTDPKNVLDKMSATFDQSSNFIGQVDELYSKGQISIGVQANLLNRNIIDVWFNVLRKPTGLKCINSGGELIADIRNVNFNRPLMLCLETLLTINALKITDLLLDNFKIQIAQSCIDEIDSFLDDMKAVPESGILSITKNGDEYYKNEFSKESATRNIEIFENLKNLLKNKASILPSQLPLNLNFLQKKEYNDLIGKCYIDSILIAKETNSVLLSDDYTNRRFAKDEFGIVSTEIFAVLNYLVGNDVITNDDFTNLTTNLIHMNYRTIPLTSSKILMDLLDKSDYQLKFPFLNACEGLIGSMIVDNVACNLISIFLKELYLDEKLKIIRDKISVQVFTYYFSGRNPKTAKKILTETLSKNFILLPIQYDNLLQILKHF